MIKNKSLILKQGGFSLVELMVVVAIIGALAMVAVPRVNRFIAKARTSEAQVNLGSIYTFNKNFFVEFQGYTNSLVAMGYNPEGRLRYNTGFATARVAPDQYFLTRGLAIGTWPAGLNTATATGGGATGLCGQNGVMANGCTALNGADGAVQPAVTGATSPAAPQYNAFVAGAIAVLVNGSNDTWSINDAKVLNQTNDGTL